MLHAQKKGKTTKIDKFESFFHDISLGFSIKCNGNELKAKEFSVLRKELSFTSPPKDKEIDELHLIIERTEYIPNSSERTENQLYMKTLI